MPKKTEDRKQWAISLGVCTFVFVACFALVSFSIDRLDDRLNDVNGQNQENADKLDLLLNNSVFDGRYICQQATAYCNCTNGVFQLNNQSEIALCQQQANCKLWGKCTFSLWGMGEI